jgi:hypothetical protein
MCYDILHGSLQAGWLTTSDLFDEAFSLITFRLKYYQNMWSSGLIREVSGSDLGSGIIFRHCFP